MKIQLTDSDRATMRAERARKDWRLQDLAEKCKPLSVPQLSQIESGGMNPSPAQWKSIRKALGIRATAKT